MATTVITITKLMKVIIYFIPRFTFKMKEDYQPIIYLKNFFKTMINLSYLAVIAVVATTFMWLGAITIVTIVIAIVVIVANYQL